MRLVAIAAATILAVTVFNPFKVTAASGNLAGFSYTYGDNCAVPTATDMPTVLNFAGGTRSNHCSVTVSAADSPSSDHSIKLSSGSFVDLNFTGSMELASSSIAIWAEGANLVLNIASGVTLTTSGAPAVYCPSGSNCTISGAGVLNASALGNAAAIGGGNAGVITIQDSVTVNAYQAKGYWGGTGATIGGSEWSAGADLTVKDTATVNAYWNNTGTDNYCAHGATIGSGAVYTYGSLAYGTGSPGGKFTTYGNPKIVIAQDPSTLGSDCSPAPAAIGSGAVVNAEGATSGTLISGRGAEVSINGGTIIIEAPRGTYGYGAAFGAGGVNQSIIVGAPSGTFERGSQPPIKITAGSVYTKAADESAVGQNCSGNCVQMPIVGMSTTQALNQFQAQPANAANTPLYPVYVPTTLNSTSVTGCQISIANSSGAGTVAPITAETAAKLPANYCGDGIACGAVAWLPGSSVGVTYDGINLNSTFIRKLTAIVKDTNTPDLTNNIVKYASTPTSPALSTRSFPDATPGFFYSPQTLYATGGQIQFKLTASSAFTTLPPGINLDPWTGVVSGTVDESATTGTYTFKVKACTDSSSTCTSEQTYTINVLPALPAHSALAHTADKKSAIVQITQPAVSAPSASQPISYCISASTSTTYFSTDPRCTPTSLTG